MRLQQISAVAHPAGNRIDLSWINPDPEQYPGVLIVRRESSHPTAPRDGVVVFQASDPSAAGDAEGLPLFTVSDTPLRGETVYYYALFPYQRDPSTAVLDVKNRAVAMATSPFGFADQMYDLLPAIYHRYDTVLPPPERVAAVDQSKGQLRRFLDLPGAQLDQLHSLARACSDLHNPDRIDGRLLPLLAQWIGWQTNYRLEFSGQRTEIRNAPEVYRRVGIIPTVETIVKRIFGWESRTKELVHNVFRSNAPERLNLWLSEQTAAGAWIESGEPVSLDFSYEGRPSALPGADGSVTLVFQTLRKGRWAVWYKNSTSFAIDAGLKTVLNRGICPAELVDAFGTAHAPLRLDAQIQVQPVGWRIIDAASQHHYDIRERGGQLLVYQWTPSQPLSATDRHERHPSAVSYRGRPWIFWDSCTADEARRRWRIEYHVGFGADGAHASPGGAPFGDSAVERKQPCAVADSSGGLWLFWLERAASSWVPAYTRYDGEHWLPAPGVVPVDQPGVPACEGDLFVLFHPQDANRKLWVFWSGRVQVEDTHQTRWQIAWRSKAGLDPAVSDWKDVQVLPKAADDDDREPAAFLTPEGDVELFWSSTRAGSWSVWRNVFASSSGDWGDREELTRTPYSERAPCLVTLGGRRLLCYRSNRTLTYGSSVYAATKTQDGRYAGATTVDTRNIAKLALRGQYDDFQCYTYDAGQQGTRTDRNWYARDTVAIHLAPAVEDPSLLLRTQKLIESVLSQFLPIQTRAVFVIEPPPYRELVYTYDAPGTEPQLIGEVVFDSLLAETYAGLADGYADTLPDWVRLRAWSPAHRDHGTVDFAASPINTTSRTWHTALATGA